MQNIERTKRAFVNTRKALLKAKSELETKTTWRNNEVDIYRHEALLHIDQALDFIKKFHKYHPEETE